MPELALNPVSKTAYYCCGLRAADAARENPICGDTFAHLFMNAEAESVFARFKRFEHANAENVARFRIIDDMLRERLRSRADLSIVLIGAGFDARAFRLAGGRWVEFDEPAVIAAKEVGVAGLACGKFFGAGSDRVCDRVAVRQARPVGGRTRRRRRARRRGDLSHAQRAAIDS